MPTVQYTFRARICLVGPLRTQCNNNTIIPTSTSNSANPPSDSPTLTPSINSITPTSIETTAQNSSPATPPPQPPTPLPPPPWSAMGMLS
ncbi:unnamed protein product [Schistocephalus solidus]|uniref:Uncharacterized protein n=1 Tax=Schistocephalus solidus TaxID=70667 RepID=A0A183T4U4_SCHSO|nr:unnamed protein product [Schistocephalus solidus]